MMALVGLVLLIACTNVALLVIARNSVRQREFAIRMALGARASRVFRQLLTESVLLVSAGGVLGWALAVGATRVLAAWAGSMRVLHQTGMCCLYRRRRVIVGSRLLACSPTRHHAHRHRTGTEE